MALPKGWFNEHEIVIYRNLIKKIPNDSHIIELGVWKGRSLCSISDLIKSKNLKVTAIDTFEGTKGEHENVDSEKLLKEFEDNINNFGIRESVEIFIGTFQEYYPCNCGNNTWKTNNFHSIFIDADHSTEAVERDYDTASKLIHPDGIICGHDYDWESVRNGLPNDIIGYGKMWWKYNKSVTAVISTKGRYETSLPICLTSIINQTEVPDEIIIYDDNNEPKDLRLSTMYNHIFKLAHKRGINLKVLYGDKKGQNYNHIRSQRESKGNYIWRVDDDLIPAPDCLEQLKKLVNENTVIAGYIDNSGEDYGIETSNLIKELRSTKLNKQWIRGYNKEEGLEHLYSSYLYKREKGNYSNKLSPLNFREETIHSFSLFADYKCNLIYYPFAENIHLGDAGGRNNDKQFIQTCIEADEKILNDLIIKHFNVKDLPRKQVVLNCGLGDTYAFLTLINKFDIENTDFYVAWKEPFDDLNIQTKSIAEAIQILNIEDYNIYAYMDKLKWSENIIKAFKSFYNV